MSSHPEKAFDWYISLVELGNFEVEHGRERFYETLKIHIAIVGGILAVASYAVVNEEFIILILGAIVGAFGAVNVGFWRDQIEASSRWESRWRQTVAAIEETPEFRSAVGMPSVKAWSHAEVRPRLSPDEKKSGASPSFYFISLNSLWCLYVILAGVSFVWAMYMVFRH